MQAKKSAVAHGFIFGYTSIVSTVRDLFLIIPGELWGCNCIPVEVVRFDSHFAERKLAEMLLTSWDETI